LVTSIFLATLSRWLKFVGMELELTGYAQFGRRLISLNIERLPTLQHHLSLNMILSNSRSKATWELLQGGIGTATTFATKTCFGSEQSLAQSSDTIPLKDSNQSIHSS